MKHSTVSLSPRRHIIARIESWLLAAYRNQLERQMARLEERMHNIRIRTCNAIRDEQQFYQRRLADIERDQTIDLENTRHQIELLQIRMASVRA